MRRILIVEDNPDLAFGLRNNLEIEGYDIAVAEDGLAGLREARASAPDLIILDLMMPGLDGYRVLRTLRDEGNSTPVLILSAKGEEADKMIITALEEGKIDTLYRARGLLAALTAMARQLPLLATMLSWAPLE